MPCAPAPQPELSPKGLATWSQPEQNEDVGNCSPLPTPLLSPRPLVEQSSVTELQAAITNSQEGHLTAGSSQDIAVPLLPLPRRIPDNSYSDLFLRSQLGNRSKAAEVSPRRSHAMPTAFDGGLPAAHLGARSRERPAGADAFACSVEAGTLPRGSTRQAAGSAQQAMRPSPPSSARHEALGGSSHHRSVGAAASGTHIVSSGITTTLGTITRQSESQPSHTGRSPRHSSASRLRPGDNRVRQTTTRGRQAWRRYPASAAAQEEGSEDEGLRDYLLSVLRAVEEAVPSAGSPVAQTPSKDQLAVALGSLHSFEAAGELTDACAICLEAMGAGQEVARLPCRHCFHIDCIRCWLPTSLSCPLCKQSTSSLASI